MINYLKHSVSIIIGIALMLSFTLYKESDNKNLIIQDSEICSVMGNPHQVPLGDALSQTAYYKTWLKYLPSQVKLNGNQLTYNPVTISDSADLVFLTCYESIFRDLNHIPIDDWLPIIAQRDYAYTIGIGDINHALQQAENSGKTPNGIRAYLAIDNLFSFDVSMMNSHVYVVPTFSRNDSTIDFIPGSTNNKYVFDLTHPCPRTCDNSSQLNNSVLPTLSCTINN